MPPEDPPTEDKPKDPPAKDDPPPKPADDQDSYWKRQADKERKEKEKLQKAQMSDLERAQAERDEAKREAETARNEAKQLKQRSRFEAAAAKAGCIDPELAFLAADTSTLGDNGEGVDKAIEAIKKAKPHLFGEQPSKDVGGSGGVTSADKKSPNQAINDEIRRFWRGG